MVHNPIPGRRQIIQKTQMANKWESEKKKQEQGRGQKVDFHAKSSFSGLFPGFFWWDESFEEGTGGVVRRQTPAIIVTECSGVCNFLGHEGKPKESTFRFGLRFKLPKEANAPWERGSGDGGF